MLWPATHVHARAARVPPQHGTLALSTVRGQRGVLVASQAGGATQVCGSARRAVLAGQRFVSARSCFVSRPPRSSFHKLSGVLTVSASASPNAPVTVWVKRMDVAGARYDIVKNVDTGQLVAEFIARWVAQAKLDIDPSLVSLRLVKCGARKPSAAEEAAAVVLDDPSLNMAEARVTGTAWLLADTVQLALLAIEREEEAERQRAERRARRDVKVLVVSFPGGRSDETWKVGDQASLASLLRGGTLAPATTPCERLTNLKVLDSGAYSFVPPEAAQDVSVLHNVTLAFDLMGEGASERVTFDSISASHLDETLRQVKALGLAETEIDARSRRNLKREFANLRSGATYWLVPLFGDTLHSQVKNFEAHNANLATGLEHEASECLEKYMRENGHPEAKRLCSTLNIPSGFGGVLEVDGVVVADNCATILEVKNSLNEAAATQLQRRLDIIWELKDSPDCPPELKVFAGKQVRGALAGRIIKPVDKTSISSQELRELWKKNGYTVLLPSGDGLGWKSSCHFTVA